ncbi:MAG TPA: beta/gamma crystallin-related protein [Caulobacteraceae bacterium]|jgi:hypothetical protein
MRRRLWALLAVGLAGAPATAAAGPHAVLFEAPSFHGRAVALDKPTPDLTAQRFAARAVSGRFDGPWILCDAPGYQGDCVRVVGAVDDFAAFGLDRRLMSLRPAGPPATVAPPTATAAAEPPPPPGNDGGYFDRSHDAVAAQRPPPVAAAPMQTEGVRGASSVFFVHPQVDGADIPSGGRDAADSFCRAQGLGPALYWAGAEGDLRDVLCRKD